jgi:Rrf2 family protein
MARLKAKVRYALLAALDLAEHYQGEEPIKLQEIAARTDVPEKYLVHILLSLKRKALVNSARGSKGGYWLTRPPDRITVAQVVDAVEPQRPSPPPAESPRGRLVNRIWTQAQLKMQQSMAAITLAEALREGGS